MYFRIVHLLTLIPTLEALLPDALGAQQSPPRRHVADEVDPLGGWQERCSRRLLPKSLQRDLR